LTGLNSKSDTINTNIQINKPKWCKHRNMFGQKPW